MINIVLFTMVYKDKYDKKKDIVKHILRKINRKLGNIIGYKIIINRPSIFKYFSG